MSSSGAVSGDAKGLIGSRRLVAGLIGVVLAKSILVAVLVATGPAPLLGPSSVPQQQRASEEPVETGNATDGTGDSGNGSDGSEGRTVDGAGCRLRCVAVAPEL